MLKLHVPRRSGGGDDGGGRKEVTKVKVGSHT